MADKALPLASAVGVVGAAKLYLRTRCDLQILDEYITTVAEC